MDNTKTSQAVTAFKNGDTKRALKLASGFKLGLSKAQSNVLKKGYECIVWPDQYRSMKQDPEKCIAEAVKLFATIFMKEEQNAATP